MIYLNSFIYSALEVLGGVTCKMNVDIHGVSVGNIYDKEAIVVTASKHVFLEYNKYIGSHV